MDELHKTAEMSPAVWGSLMGGMLAPGSQSVGKSVAGGAATGLLGTAIANAGNFASMSPLLSGGLLLGGSVLGGLSGLLKNQAMKEKALMAQQVGAPNA
ncbi:MAG: hypothetical protein EBU84_00400 [Actinobacteria bacterium]|nr:hypothetical protein [Actinomycetota bacterium]